LHYSGPLLEWMEQAHPEYFAQLLLRRRPQHTPGTEFRRSLFYSSLLHLR
jgi:hypothetical protein